MKTSQQFAVFLVGAALAAVGCDQNKSGPVEPTADEPTTTEEAESAKAPITAPARAPLYEAGGPGEAVKVGEKSEVKLSISPADGFKINKMFDWNFEFHPSDTIAMESNTVSSDDVQLEDAGATIPVSVTAKKAGDHELKATGDFSVCNDSKCELYRDQEVTFRLSATDG